MNLSHSATCIECGCSDSCASVFSVRYFPGSIGSAGASGRSLVTGGEE